LIESAPRADSLNLTVIAMLAGSALGSFALGGYIESEWPGIRLAVSLLVAMGLLLRAGKRGRWLAFGCGSLVVVACSLQLATFLVGVPKHPGMDVFGTHSFFLGMFCVGLALMLDGILPVRWGRHLLFGLLGAVAAMIGAAGLFVVLAGLENPVDDTLLAGTRLATSTTLLLAGLS
jgi:hypothetical protein